MNINTRKLCIEDKVIWESLLFQLNATQKPCGKIDDLLADHNFFGLIIENDKQVIGFGSISFFRSSFKGLTGVIEDIIIEKEYRGKGLGEELMIELLQEAKARNAQLVTLTSNPNRTAARRLYEKLGFELYNTGFFTKKL